MRFRRDRVPKFSYFTFFDAVGVVARDVDIPLVAAKGSMDTPAQVPENGLVMVKVSPWDAIGNCTPSIGITRFRQARALGGRVSGLCSSFGNAMVDKILGVWNPQSDVTSALCAETPQTVLFRYRAEAARQVVSKILVNLTVRDSRPNQVSLSENVSTTDSMRQP